MATGEKKIFEQVYERQNGVSYITDNFIPFELAKHWNFMHILSKNKFPEFRLNPVNIILVEFEIHRIWDFGTYQQMAKKIREGFNFWKIIDLYDKLYKEYKEKHSTTVRWNDYRTEINKYLK